MLDRLRPDHIRRVLRQKALRVVEDVTARYHQRQVDELHRTIAELRAELRAELDRGRDQICGEIRAQADRAVDAVVAHEIRARRDVVFAGEQEAALQTARFVREHLPTARHFGHPHRTLEHALSVTPDTGGMALEFGVFQGTTLKIIAAARGGREVYGFDSFEGLPEDWRSGFPAGEFTTDGVPDVPGAELVAGWFDETLPGFLAGHTGHVDFLHVDCDLYSSTRTVLDLVGPRLRPGSVIVFDEYFNYPGWQEHEHRAWQEYVTRTGMNFEYLAYTFDNEQVVIRVTTP